MGIDIMTRATIFSRAREAAQAEGNLSPEELNKKVAEDWVLVKEAGELRITLHFRSAAATARVLDGLDLLVGAVIAISMGDESGLVRDEEHNEGPVNPWRESALIVAEAGTGTIWFALKFSATSKLLKSVGRSKLAGMVLVAIIQSFVYHGIAKVVHDSEELTEQNTERISREEVEDLVSRAVEAAPPGGRIVLELTLNGKSCEVAIDPPGDPEER